MGTTEVTIGQFKQFAAATGYQTVAEKAELAAKAATATRQPSAVPPKPLPTYLNPGYPVTDDSPAAVITWNDAQEFCNWLSEHEQVVYRLPTEAEWEYACRAGTTTQYSFGDEHAELEKYAWYSKNDAGRLHPVGTKPANPFGLHDLQGSVWEWCQDFWDDKWYEKSLSQRTPPSDPTGPAGGSYRVIRGGYWQYSASACRSASRTRQTPSHQDSGYGFRCVCELVVPVVTTSVPATTQPAIQPTPRPTPVGPQPSPAVAPFDATQAKAHQEAWVKHLGIEVETPNSVGMKMVLIPPGEFMMGSTDDQVEAALKVAERNHAEQRVKDNIETERPQHKVVISKPFLTSATEVTIGQFKTFSATGYQTEAEIAAKAASPQAPAPGQSAPAPPRTHFNPGYAVTDDSPAAVISWNDAVAYCRWLSEQEQTTYRLPTEAEWEYACRAGTTTQYSFGDDYGDVEHYAWYNKNAAGRSHQVGTRRANPFGLFDMHGNLQEWCADWYDEKWYENSPSTDPNGPSSGSHRVIRGGYWSHDAPSCRSAYRPNNTPTTRLHVLGFRIVRELPAPSTTASVTPQPTVPVAAPAKLFMHDPAFPQWLKDVQAKTAEVQVEAVRQKLMELNPGFDGILAGLFGTGLPKVEDHVVTQLSLVTDHVRDLSPIRALVGLRGLTCGGTSAWGKVDDLSFVESLPLVYLACPSTKIKSLLPLQGKKLTHLYCDNTPINDLSVLKGMPLEILYCTNTQVFDLSAIEGSKSLTILRVKGTKATPAGVAALQKALPNCKIEWDDPAKPAISQPAPSGTTAPARPPASSGTKSTTPRPAPSGTN